jgi:hypothetical protein
LSICEKKKTKWYGLNHTRLCIVPFPNVRINAEKAIYLMKIPAADG